MAVKVPHGSLDAEPVQPGDAHGFDNLGRAAGLREFELVERRTLILSLRVLLDVGCRVRSRIVEVAGNRGLPGLYAPQKHASP